MMLKCKLSFDLSVRASNASEAKHTTFQRMRLLLRATAPAALAAHQQCSTEQLLQSASLAEESRSAHTSRFAAHHFVKLVKLKHCLP